jgi:hypothetical protein
MLRKFGICLVVFLIIGSVLPFGVQWYHSLPKSVELVGVIRIAPRPQIIKNPGQKDQVKYSEGTVLYSNNGTFPLFGDTQSLFLYNGEPVRVTGSIVTDQFQRLIVSHYEPLDKGITIKYGRLKSSSGSKYKYELILPDNSSIKLSGNLYGLDIFIDKLVIVRGQVENPSSVDSPKDALTVKSFDEYKPE